MVTHSPRAFPWEIEPPVGNHHVKGKHRPKARARRPRARPCLNKGCGRKYQPQRWNQRYCQDPECLREVNRWQAAQRQAKRRKEDAEAKAEHAHAERARRQRATSTPQVAQSPEVAPARGHAAGSFLALPLCKRPGCHEHPVSSLRNLARYCCLACRQAVRNVLDRERKWLSRGTSDGRKKRAIEYEAAWRGRVLRQRHIPEPAPPRPPPG
jgi:hypothetical protein